MKKWIFMLLLAGSIQEYMLKNREKGEIQSEHSPV